MRRRLPLFIAPDNKAMDTKPRKDVKFTNYADGVAIVSAPFYLQAAPSRLGHRKRYTAFQNTTHDILHLV